LEEGVKILLFGFVSVTCFKFVGSMQKLKTNRKQPISMFRGYIFYCSFIYRGTIFIGGYNFGEKKFVGTTQVPKG
jgi:hypothetical protein